MVDVVLTLAGVGENDRTIRPEGDMELENTCGLTMLEKTSERDEYSNYHGARRCQEEHTYYTPVPESIQKIK